MPIFEYRCKQCDHVTAFLEGAGGKRKHPCQNCGSQRTEKVFSTFAARSASTLVPCEGCDPSTCPSGQCPMHR